MGEIFSIGDVVADKVTGFSGLVTARLEAMGARDRIRVTPVRLKDNGELAEDEWFDAGRLEAVQAEQQ